MTNDVHIAGRMMLYKELRPLFEMLSSFRYAIVKGEVLSQQIYGEPNKRHSGDIDILIDRKNVRFLEECLKKIGFEQKTSQHDQETRYNRILCMAYSHQIPSYHKDKFGFHFNVDINYDIFWGEYTGQRYSIDEFLSDTEEIRIYSTAVKGLSIEKAFVQLILHHYKEMNSLYHLSHHNCIRTSAFRDIHDILQKHSELLSTIRIKELCEQYSIGQYIYYMIYYTWQVFRSDFLTKHLQALEFYENKELIESYGLCEKERKKWKIPFNQILNNNHVQQIILEDLTNDDLEKIKLNENLLF